MNTHGRHAYPRSARGSLPRPHCPCPGQKRSPAAKPDPFPALVSTYTSLYPRSQWLPCCLPSRSCIIRPSSRRTDSLRKGERPASTSPVCVRRTGARRAFSWSRPYFSASTYSASITPSSLAWLSAVPAPALAPSVGGTPLPPACALYSASASLWLAVVSRSRAAFSSVALGSPVNVLLASASAVSTSPLSAACTLSPPSRSIFSTL